MPRLSKIGAAALAAFGWTSGTGAATTVTASYLQVAGGGGSGGGNGTYPDGGGGGAGGLLTSTTTLNLSSSYTVIVGAGGVGAPSGSANAQGGSGSNSSITGLTASVGGGGGGTRNAAGTTNAGVSGGSGGGAAINADASASGAVGSGTSGQGSAGGSAFAGATSYAGGGGGGSSAVGGNATSSAGGNGGAGTASSITGSSVTYAGGGGGGSRTGSGGSGGSGGGGAGGVLAQGTAGSANTGGGAGGSDSVGSVAGANGGSGVVIISYSGAQQFGGGVVTSVGGNTIHTFTTSGTLSPLNQLSASYLIVAGGGGGGAHAAGGGGGAGGMLTGSGIVIDTNSTYLVTVGAGGTGGTTSSSSAASSGANSSFSVVPTSAVGGGAGSGGNPGFTASTGGSGGGGGGFTFTAGAGTSGQGNNGGTGVNRLGAGGGGAGAVGGNAVTTTNAGSGGNGLASSISGTSVTYAGGGGGGSHINYPNGAGGTGGGGTGGAYANPGNGGNGTDNLGGGGGGAGGRDGLNAGAGGNGGSGVVIISYAGSTQQMAGGTVTISGGNVIHTFTSSGYLSPLTFVGNSLRFRQSNSAYLSRPQKSGNTKTWTWSGWVKRGALTSANNQNLFGTIVYPTPSNYQSLIYFKTNDTFEIFNYTGSTVDTQLTTTQVFRDPAAWYHIVIATDTTQATASNRIKMYVNGVQVTSFTTATYPSQNYDTWINNTSASTVALGATAPYVSAYLDGEMANVQFIDGQALAPTAFGTFNQYGVWQPINYGGSYGTNGFYLPFTGTTNYAGGYNGSQGLVAPATGFNASTGDWTVEGWAYSTSSSANEALLTGVVSGTDYFYLNFVGTTFYFGDGATNTISVTNAKPANQWFHWAAVKNGSTYTVYFNGVAIGSSTTALRSGALTQWQIGYRPSVSYNWNGYISNVRIVNGTAVYTGNFVPQTTPLTAITNTQLLTLQNATIVDNSTNAYTITNVGSVTTSQSFPFVSSVGQDKGPAGNNWTSNNFGNQITSGIDSMTDVPTLTSATAANYAVLNPLSNTSTYPYVSSNGNLSFTANANGNGSSQLGTFAVSSGQWYWEVTPSSAWGGGGCIGIVGTAFNPNFQADSYFWNFSYGYGYDMASGRKNNNNTQTTYGASYSSGDTIGVALDLNAGTLTFYKNGTSQGTAFTGLSGSFFPASYCYSSATGSVNFGQQPFQFTPPSGFVALNTYNL